MILILTITIMWHHTEDIVMASTLNEDRMEIKKKQKKHFFLLMMMLVCKMSVMPPHPRNKHPPPNPTKKRQKRQKNKNRQKKPCLLRVISQVDEIFQNNQPKNSLRIVQV